MFYSYSYIEIDIWKILRIIKTFQSNLFEWNVFQCCLIPSEKPYYIISSVNLDIIYVLLKSSNTLFFNLESHVLPFLNMKYSLHDFLVELVDLQS